MEVKLRLQQSSEPMVFKDIKNAYTKDNLFCMRLQTNETLKFPLVSIFSILESNGYSSQVKKPVK